MYNPVFFSFVIVTMSTFELFVDPVKLNPGIVQTIQGDGGTIYLYEEVIDRLEFHVSKSFLKILVFKSAVMQPNRMICCFNR